MDPDHIFQQVQLPAAEALKRAHSSGSLGVPQGYPEFSSRTSPPAIPPGRRQTLPPSPMHTDSVSAEFSPLTERAGAGLAPSPATSISPFPVGNYHREDHADRISIPKPYGAQIPVAHSSCPLSAPLPAARPTQHRQSGNTMGYSGVYSMQETTPHGVSFSSPPPPPPASYFQGGFHGTTPSTAIVYPSHPHTPYHQHLEHQNHQSTESGSSYSASISPSFNSPAGASSTLIGAVDEPVTGMVGLSINSRVPTSTTFTTTLQMNVNVTSDRLMAMDSTRIRSSSIPMSNGDPPSPPIDPTAPRRPAPWPSYSQQHPVAPPTLASMSISAIGNAFEMKAEVTYTPPLPPLPPRPHSTSGVMRNHDQRQPDSESSPSIHIHRRSSEAPTTQHSFSLPAPTALNTEFVEEEAADVPHSEGGQVPTQKRRKKAKMHECSVCGKEFPRPSGLHTHMNTHNNAKPFPCTYPGCDRMFGVRSNAKRHLRTHGITPISSSSPPSTAPGASPAPMPALRSPAATDAKPVPEQPYVVGFSEPVIVQSPMGVVQGKGATHRIRNNMTSGDTISSRKGGRQGGGTGGSTSSTYKDPPYFKLRWLPPSLTSRTNAAALRNVSEKGVFEDEDEDEDEMDIGESNHGGRGAWGRE